MQKIDGVSLVDELRKAAAEELESQQANVRGRIRLRIQRLNGDIARKERLEAQIKEQEEALQKIEAGDWSMLDDDGPCCDASPAKCESRPINGGYFISR